MSGHEFTRAGPEFTRVIKASDQIVSFLPQAGAQLPFLERSRVRVAKSNVHENPRTAARFKVQGIPTLLAIKNGREVDRMVGVQPKSEIVRRLQQLVA